VPVRSDRLASGTIVASSFGPTFTVPGGETWLVKSAYGNRGTGTSGTVVILASAAGASVAVAVITVAASGSFRWDGWLAIDPGGTLRVQNATDSALNYWVSGARLPGAAPASLAPGTLPSATP
jgi:hypothetical protein